MHDNVVLTASEQKGFNSPHSDNELEGGGDPEYRSQIVSALRGRLEGEEGQVPQALQKKRGLPSEADIMETRARKKAALQVPSQSC